MKLVMHLTQAQKKTCKIWITCVLLSMFAGCGKKTNAINGSGVTPVTQPVIVNDSLAYSENVVGNGANGYASYRIPAIIKTPDGGLLAFMEGRVNSSADFGNIKILAQKSMDNGKNWAAATLVAQNGSLQADNATPVVDYTDPLYPKGRIFLFYCTGNNTQANVINLSGVREVFYVTSIDNGKTWSAPVNITLQVHHPYQPAFYAAYTDPLKWSAYATGPGHALQVTQGSFAGRLVVPFNHGIYTNKTNYAAVFYTDDHGNTFHISPDVTMQSDETTAAELPGGGIILNSRDQYLGVPNRIISYDNTGKLDNATQWGSAFNTGLPEPVCEGSMLNYTTPGGKQVLLFVNPNDTNARDYLGVRQSFDGGKTWTRAYIVDQGASAYSDIVALPNGHIGVLYEATNNMQFVSFSYSLIPTL
ncbi:MAG: sialidase family protein [Mucilaginibacter sp.]